MYSYLHYIWCFRPHKSHILCEDMILAMCHHSEESKYTSASPRCTCFPPRATSTQVRLVQVQVQLGFASLDLNLDSAYLRGVSGGHLVQLQLKSPSSSPSSPRLRLVELGLDSGNLSEVRQVHIPPLTPLPTVQPWGAVFRVWHFLGLWCTSEARL